MTVVQTTVNSALETVASLATMNPITIAATSMTATGLVTATALDQVGEAVGSMAAMMAGQTPPTATTPVGPTTGPNEVSPLQMVNAAATPTPTGGLGATPEDAQGTARTGVLSPSLPDAPLSSDAASPATPEQPRAEANSERGRQDAGRDRQDSRKDRSDARQDRSDRDGGDRERPHRDRDR